MISVCRLCLSSSADHYETVAATDEYFQLILPEIDIQLVQSPMFCQSCVDLLQTTYSFKSKCIKTEKMLKLYALNCGGRQLLLSDVLQSNCLEKNRLLSGNDDADASSNKYIKEECDNDSFGCELDGARDNLQSCPEIKVEVNGGDCSNSDDDENHDRQHKCNICQKGYDKKEYFLDHIRTHFTKSACKLCGKQFYNVPVLKQHLATAHQIDVSDDVTWRDHMSVAVDETKVEEALKQHGIEEVGDEENTSDKSMLDRRYKCSICEKGYKKKQYLLDHIRIHFTKSNCNLCGKGLYNVGASKRHVLVMHQIDTGDDRGWRDHITVLVDVPELEEALKQHGKLYEMDHDDNKSDCDKDQLYKLKKIASVLYKYTCETCGKQFKAKTSLNRHTLIHGVKKSLTCDHCQKKFLTKERLEMHISACHHNLICDTCGYTTTKKNNFNDHIRTHTGEKPYTCNLCDKAFTQRSSLGTHMRTVHSTERFFTCEYCSKSFKIKGSLTKHILEVHLIDKIEKKFICNYCGKKYRLQHQLNRHLKWHKSDRPFSCNMCDKAFVDKDTLRKHNVTHLAEKKHKCEICGKGFHQKYNIKIHMKVHGLR